MNQQIFNVINDNKYWEDNYVRFFLIECRPFISQKLYEELKEGLGLENLEKYEKRRDTSKNDTYLCQLIREDKVVDFILHVNSSSKISSSIYETNPFLIDKQPSLIEYEAFFGSIEIFQYLRLYNADLDPSLWLYSIHGRNPDIIHHLE